MYTPAPPRRPWRNSRGHCRWFPDKMIQIGRGRYITDSGRPRAAGNTKVAIRKNRVKQRRLDAYLCRSEEW
jgi:hypothetical protein